jgi:hypothetical protein
MEKWNGGMVWVSNNQRETNETKPARPGGPYGWIFKLLQRTRKAIP